MPTLAVQNPTLLDLAKRKDPDGSIAQIIELLSQTNEILEDMTWIEGNLETGHRTTVRTGLPTVTWRKLYGGVQPSKSTTAQVTESTGMLEAYAEVDPVLARLAGDPAAFRLSEEKAFIQAMNNELAQTIMFGTEVTAPEEFTGFAPRFNSLSAENGQNIIDAGGTGADNTSIWLIGWGENSCHGLVPKGSTAGLEIRDLGEVTVENIDGANGRAQMLRTHYRMSAGLCVRDWRYVVRVANIDKSLLTPNTSTGADIIDLMVQALERIESVQGVRPAFYCSRRTRAFLRRQMLDKLKNSTLSMDTIAGKRVMSFDGVPIRRVDQLDGDEARVV